MAWPKALNLAAFPALIRPTKSSSRSVLPFFCRIISPKIKRRIRIKRNDQNSSTITASTRNIGQNPLKMQNVAESAFDWWKFCWMLKAPANEEENLPFHLSTFNYERWKMMDRKKQNTNTPMRRLHLLHLDQLNCPIQYSGGLALIRNPKNSTQQQVWKTGI